MSRSLRRTFGALVATTLISGLLLPVTTGSADETPVAVGQPTELVRYFGDGSSATGAALGNGACDVNGDDFDDAVVGAWFWDKAPLANIGAAYVLLGGADLTGGSLNTPSQANAVRIDGPNSNGAFVGFSVGCLGDVNGDGFDDIGISYYDNQQIFVVLGAENFGSVNLDALGDRGFVVKSAVGPGGNLGYAMSAVGDVNGDGLGDFGVGEVVADNNGRTNSGRVWIIAGQDDIADVDVLHPAADQIILTLDGAAAQERLGTSASVGDVNGDGIDDMLFGSYVATPWGTAVTATGAAYVIFGGTTGTVDAAAIGDKGFTVNGPARQRDRLGISVAAAGDVNGDGKADLLIGADGVNNAVTGPRNGGAAIVYGSAEIATVFTDPTKATSVYTCTGASTLGVCADADDVVKRGYWINGAANGDSTGYSVAGVGDLNDDGTPDFALGAYGYDPVNPADASATMAGAGAVWAVYGDPTGTNVELAALVSEKGYRIDGLAAGDRFGRQVAGVGDVDGNGMADFVGSGDFAKRPLSPGTPLEQAGEVVLALIGKHLTSTTATIDPAAPGLRAGFTVNAVVAPVSTVRGEIAGGTVTVSVDGTAVCADLEATGGAVECVVAENVVGPGSHQVTATFSGTARWAASEAEPVIFDTALQQTSTAVTLPASVYRAGVAVPVSVTVSGPVSTPTGRVRLTNGALDLGTADLIAGTATFTVPGTSLAIGNRTLTAGYLGSDSARPSAGTVKLTVAKAIPKIKLTVPKSTVKKASRPVAATITISAAGLVPTGYVLVRSGTTKLRSAVLQVGNKGVIKITLPTLSVKKHPLTVSYQGDGKVGSGTSAVVTLTVTK